MTKADEQQTIELAAAGDRDACERLIREHQQSVYAYLLRLSGRPDVAEDIAQEAFVRVLSNLDRFDFRFRFSTWLFTIAKRLFVNASQRFKPAYDSEIVGAWRSAGDSPEAPTVDAEVQDNARDSLQRSLMLLPAEQREILILFHQQDWPIALIAQHMRMPEGTVKSHLHRGRRKMREVLERCEQDVARVKEVWS